MAGKNSSLMSVKSLVEESGLGEDEVFIALWLQGLWEYDKIESRIRSKDQIAARNALGLERSGRENHVTFWMSKFNCSRDELTEILKPLGVDLKQGTRSLPKGAVSKLRKHTKSLVESNESTKTEENVQDAETSRVPPPTWLSQELRQEIKYITVEQVQEVFSALDSAQSGEDEPVSTPGVKSTKLLDSAVSRPQMAPEKYHNVFLATAAVVHGLIKNHSFPNGNKRTAVISMFVMLDENGYTLSGVEESEIFKFAYDVASSTLLESDKHSYENLWEHETLAMANWLEYHAKPKTTETRNRPLKWSTLKRILLNLGCEIASSGNTVTVSREIESGRGIFSKTKKPSFKFTHNLDGVDIDKGLIASMRARLELDSDHGVSNATFYSKTPALPSEFVTRYSSLIRRLARF